MQEIKKIEEFLLKPSNKTSFFSNSFIENLIINHFKINIRSEPRDTRRKLYHHIRKFAKNEKKFLRLNRLKDYLKDTSFFA